MSMGKFYEGPKDGTKYSWILYPRFHVNADRRVDKANCRSSHREVFCQENVLKDTPREKALSNKTPALYKKYKHGHLGCSHNKSTLYKRFLNWNKTLKKIK